MGVEERKRSRLKFKFLMLDSTTRRSLLRL